MLAADFQPVLRLIVRRGQRSREQGEEQGDAFPHNSWAILLYRRTLYRRTWSSPMNLVEILTGVSCCPRPLSAPRETLPAEYPRGLCASSASCLLFVSPAACACA